MQNNILTVQPFQFLFFLFTNHFHFYFVHFWLPALTVMSELREQTNFNPFRLLLSEFIYLLYQQSMFSFVLHLRMSHIKNTTISPPYFMLLDVLTPLIDFPLFYFMNPIKEYWSGLSDMISWRALTTVFSGITSHVKRERIYGKTWNFTHMFMY